MRTKDKHSDTRCRNTREKKKQQNPEDLITSGGVRNRSQR